MDFCGHWSYRFFDEGWEGWCLWFLQTLSWLRHLALDEGFWSFVDNFQHSPSGVLVNDEIYDFFNLFLGIDGNIGIHSVGADCSKVFDSSLPVSIVEEDHGLVDIRVLVSRDSLVEDGLQMLSCLLPVSRHHIEGSFQVQSCWSCQRQVIAFLSVFSIFLQISLLHIVGTEIHVEVLILLALFPCFKAKLNGLVQILFHPVVHG